VETLTPQVTAAPGSYIITWPLEPEPVQFGAKRVHQHTDGRLTGVVSISVGRNSHEVALAHSQLNLASSQSRRGIAKALEERYPLPDDLPWDQVVETSCRLIMEREDEGEPVTELERTQATEVRYLIPGLILDRMPTVVYGPGANGKSLLALLLALLVHNGIDLSAQAAPQRNVLVLDYEADVDEAARRATMLAAGIERSAPITGLRLPLFRRCLRPLMSEVTELAGIMLEYRIGLVIVDSFGPAVAADVTMSEQTLAYFAALRQLCSVTGAASLTLSHVTKQDRREPGAHRLPYGSVYVENSARAMFELRREDIQKRMRISLLPRKCNVAELEPRGYEFAFGTEAILTKVVKAEDVTVDQSATRELILEELAKGPARVQELIDAIGESGPAVRMALSRLNKEGLVTNT